MIYNTVYMIIQVQIIESSVNTIKYYFIEMTKIYYLLKLLRHQQPYTIIPDHAMETRVVIVVMW